MSISESIRRIDSVHGKFNPDTGFIEEAVDRVNKRWPDEPSFIDEDDQERLVQILKQKFNDNDWEDTRISLVLKCARSVFDISRIKRSELSELRNFLFAETAAHGSIAFLSGMFKTYLETYVPKATHTIQFAKAISKNFDQFGIKERTLCDRLPHVLDPESGHEETAKILLKSENPYAELIEWGITYPHGAGFMDHVHNSLTQLVQPKLEDYESVEWYLRWLKPDNCEPRLNGAKVALEALIHPWLKKNPNGDLLSLLREKMISMYGDIRLGAGKVWASVGKKYKDVLHRWLTKEYMEFFIKMVDRSQDSHMWVDRREFWRELYGEGIIDEAWVAFSSEATRSVKQYLLSHTDVQTSKRFGWQRAREGKNTSLLIMKIGNKIVVEGCQNYKTHMFLANDPMSPKLFQDVYDCDEIRDKSPISHPHNHIPTWIRWVRDTINSDIPFSSSRVPYREYSRPDHLQYEV